MIVMAISVEIDGVVAEKSNVIVSPAVNENPLIEAALDTELNTTAAASHPDDSGGGVLVAVGVGRGSSP